MVGVYLAAFEAFHPEHNIVYQDINGKRDICGDMLDVDLSQFDYIIATPPCNYYSRANYLRETSRYSQLTKHLLPNIIDKLCKQDKPFIVENVRNSRIFNAMKLFDKPCFIYFIGRHTYWTNILLTVDVPQRQDFKRGGYVIRYDDMSNLSHQGGYNVHQVIEVFIQTVEKGGYIDGKKTYEK